MLDELAEVTQAVLSPRTAAAGQREREYGSVKDNPDVLSAVRRNQALKNESAGERHEGGNDEPG